MEFSLRFIQYLVTLVQVVVSTTVAITSWRKKPTIPPIKNKLLTLSVLQLVQRLKLQEVSSKELVQAYIDRINEVNRHINAVIEDRFDEALSDAEKADKLISECPFTETETLFERYPLLGIPFTVKESCGVKGMSHVVGSLNRSNYIAEHDCIPVRNLRSAGAIPLLVSANPEYCFSIETYSYTNGRCVNPYNRTRTAGGSSGGEGALNGSGASLFGIGSDIAGSIRIPSLFNGVFGHKPTGGLISNRGHFPNCDDLHCLEYLQMGPITRFGGDLLTLLRVMAGTNAYKLDLRTPVDTKKVKIFYALGFEGLNGFLHQRVSLGIQSSILFAVRYFKRNGIATRKVNIRNFHNSTEIALTGLARLRNFPYVMTPGDRPHTIKENLKELYRSLMGSSRYTKEALIFELMRLSNAFMGADKMAKYEEEAAFLKQELVDLLGSDGVLFFPTFHVPAIPNNSSLLPLWGIDYPLIFNILGLPCTHVPMGLNSKGLPVGFQIVAAPMRDKLCLHVAAELEKGFGGWVPPIQHDF